MCVGIYIGSDCELYTVEWDQSRPAFYVCVDAKHTTIVREYFSKPYLYAVGCHMGCGCGFQDFERSDPQEGEYGGEGLQSRNALVKYLALALKRQATVEVFVCINSAVAPDPPTRHRRVKPADYLRDRTLFDPGQMVVVSEQDVEASR